MTNFFQTRAAFVGIGVVIGLVIGLNIEGIWPSVPLHASATHGLDKFAIATGLVDNGVEALYFLDYLTGDMRAAVLNPKTGKFNSFFSRNIAADFGGAGRTTGYLMVTGSVDMPRGASPFQFARSIVYVADATTGQVAAYTIPWSSSMQAAGQVQYGEFQPLDVKPFRTAFIRDEAGPQPSTTPALPRSAPKDSRMTVHVNGEPRELAPSSTVAGLLAELHLAQPHVAVELNQQVVPRAEHRGTLLHEGDRLEVVTLVGGG